MSGLRRQLVKEITDRGRAIRPVNESRTNSGVDASHGDSRYHLPLMKTQCERAPAAKAGINVSDAMLADD